MTRRELVIKKIEDAYTDFEIEMISMTAKEVYDYSYKIYSIKEIFEILINGYDFSNEVMNSILEFKGNILEQIYLEWSSSDYNHQDNFKDIIKETFNSIEKAGCVYV